MSRVPASHNNTRDPYGQLWLDNYGPVARDFHLWIAGASNVGPIIAGPWQGRRSIGCSLLVGPDEKQVLMGPYGERAEALCQGEVSSRGVVDSPTSPRSPTKRRAG